jgi:transcriptional regulator with XRE-family HTH domain
MIQATNPDKRCDNEMLDDAGTLDDAVRGFLAEDEESRRAYLKESWLAAAIAQLRRARQRAGLTQQELADRLGTRQPAIARLERGEDTTLGRLWDYLYACGEVPAEIETVWVAELIRFVEADPSAERTVSAVRTRQTNQHGDDRLAGAVGGRSASGTANGQPIRHRSLRPARTHDV